MAVTIEQLIASAEQHEASDLFITEGCVGRAKIGGRIMVLGDDRVEKDDMASFWRECGADPDIDWDKDAAYESGDGIRFRVNLHRTMGRLSAVLRQIRTQVPNMESLGLPESLLVDWMSRPSGFVLVTGATGFVGQALLDAAQHAGTPLRALARREQAARSGVDWLDRKSTRLNSSHLTGSRMPSSA